MKEEETEKIDMETNMANLQEEDLEVQEMIILKAARGEMNQATILEILTEMKMKAAKEDLDPTVMKSMEWKDLEDLLLEEKLQEKVEKQVLQDLELSLLEELLEKPQLVVEVRDQELFSQFMLEDSYA